MLPDQGKTAFLISKPLQLMIALCIAQQCKWKTKPIFIILDLFSGARDVARQLSSEFSEVQSPIFFSSRQAAFSFIRRSKFSHLFIDSDVGVRNFLTLAIQKISNHRLSIHVYEEGLGTYRTDLYSGLKQKLFNAVGIGVFFGACRFVTSVYVFNSQEYIDNIPSNKFKVRKIQRDFPQFLTANNGALKRVFGFSGVASNSRDVSLCAIYLSNWSIDEEFISYFKGLNGDLFIKPHPHIKNTNEYEGVRTLGANVPAELVIGDLMETYEAVCVFDHQSSVRRYVFGPNLTFAVAQAKAIRDHAALEQESAI